VGHIRADSRLASTGAGDQAGREAWAREQREQATPARLERSLLDREATPREELSYLLAAFEHISPPPHRTSYLSTVILDLICVLELDEIYSAAAHDLAVHAPAELLHLPTTRGQYLFDGDEIQQATGLQYNEGWAPTDGWKSAAHHDDVDPSWLEANGRRWEKLALSTVTRDRHDIGLIRRLVENASGDHGTNEVRNDSS
jgi:hypothetical protein